ncbi:hypothetical protein [Burkholderia sp. AU38729]|uniref:hypothetical protein n=1 Tax=Burkholderia sp. AU38729 TaxID=2879633 RepID=UPI001CF3FCBB|nr:hypothetical protein [Burkholderia sp. AU38729]MCA8064305.1 hypothetical protein [Burkholderia sp. AU38729]
MTNSTKVTTEAEVGDAAALHSRREAGRRVDPTPGREISAAAFPKIPGFTHLIK